MFFKTKNKNYASNPYYIPHYPEFSLTLLFCVIKIFQPYAEGSPKPQT